MGSKFNVHQQVFGLSLASNIVGSVNGTQEALQAVMEAELPEALKLVGDGWEVVWGPVVWKSKPKDAKSGPDNSWYIARNPYLSFDDENHDTYVVAIAGTAGTYDWLAEDFGVFSLVDFEGWVAAGIQTPPVTSPPLDRTRSYIGEGTAGAVYTLLTQAAPPGAAGASLTLFNFLATLRPSDQSRLIFTGHSLGGALSPTLALALLQADVLQRFNVANVLTYPTAGPSPGNTLFANLFASKFPKSAGSGYQVWNCNIINLLDIVPKAWCTDPSLAPKQNLSNIPSIFGRPAVLLVQVAVDIMIVLVNNTGVTYFPLQSSSFTGTPPAARPTSFKAFLKDAGEQHVSEYQKFIGVQVPMLELTPSLRRQGIKNISLKTDPEILRTYPVISDIDRLATDTERHDGLFTNAFPSSLRFPRCFIG